MRNASVIFAVVITAVFTAALSVSGAEKTAPEQPWQEASLGLFNNANRAFTAETQPTRETRFGEAITLLNVQPRTDSNLERAESLFQALVAENPTDNFGLSARYFLARIPQVHRTPIDLVEARKRFAALVDSTAGSAHPLAQRALVELAVIDLYADVSVEEVRSRHAAFAKRAASLTDANARRDFELVLGQVALSFKLGDALALEHLLAADAAGFARITVQADTWVRIAELARRTGRADVAANYYQQFLNGFPRDSRRRIVEERLAALNEKPAASPTLSH